MFKRPEIIIVVYFFYMAVECLKLHEGWRNIWRFSLQSCCWLKKVWQKHNFLHHKSANRTYWTKSKLFSSKDHCCCNSFSQFSKICSCLWSPNSWNLNWGHVMIEFRKIIIRMLEIRKWADILIHIWIMHYNLVEKDTIQDEQKCPPYKGARLIKVSVLSRSSSHRRI